MTTVVGIVNPWPQAGKTAMAVNLAASLALLEKKTLLVDSDPQGRATASLSGGTADGQPGLYPVLTGREQLGAVIRPTAFDHFNDYLGMIPAGNDLSRAEDRFSLNSGLETLLRGAVRSAPEDIEYVIIDAPSSMGFLTTGVVAAADFLLIPVPCRAEAAASLGSLLALVRQVRQDLNPGLRIAGVVFTQCDGEEDIRSRIPADLLAGLKPVLLDIVINREDEAQGDVPVVAADVMSIAAEKYLDLAVVMVEKKQKKAARA